MSDEARERILDALLEELLGNELPPDLKDRILNNHRASEIPKIAVRVARASSNGNQREAPLPRVTPVIPNRARSRAVRRRIVSLASSVAIVMIAATTFAIWALNLREQQRLANLPPKTTLQRPTEVTETIAAQPHTNLGNPMPEATNTPPPAAPELVTSETVVPESNPQRDDTSEFEKPPSPPTFVRSIPLQDPSADSRIIDFIDTRLSRSWEQHSISPTAQVHHLIWLRRVTEFLVGRQPTAEEKKAYSADRDPEEAVDALLASQEFAQHWSDQLATVLVGSEANQTGKRFHRSQLRDYLLQAIQTGTAYDQIAFELMTAIGSNDPEHPTFNPAVNFLLAYQAIESIQGSRDPSKKTLATDRVCQVLLGKQLQCAKCHDDAESGITQQQYYQLAAFFTQMQSTRPAAQRIASQLLNRDFGGSSGSIGDADLFFTTSDDVGVSVYPRFLDGRQLGTTSGRVRDVDRRAALAQMIVSSEEFSMALVNRLWARAFGRGFTRPVDNMGTHNPATHPDLLNRLAREFANSQFHLQSPLRWIALSNPFQRRVRSASDRLANGPDLFSSYARHDQLYHPRIGPALARIARARAKTGDQFDRTELLANLDSGKPISRQRRQREIQRINSRLREKLLRATQNSMLSKITRNSTMDDSQRVSHVFLATVGRRPTRAELKHGIEMLKHGSTLSALQDIGWVLLNSEEFASQH